MDENKKNESEAKDPVEELTDEMSELEQQSQQAEQNTADSSQEDDSQQTTEQSSDDKVESEQKENTEEDTEEDTQSEDAQTEPSDSGQKPKDILQKRIIGGFIDFVIVGAATSFMYMPGAVFLPGGTFNLSNAYGFFLFTAAAIILLVKDMPFKVGPLENQTPGKKAMGIKVCKLNGEPIDMNLSIKRNLLTASPYIAAAISMLFSVIHIQYVTFFISLIAFAVLSTASIVALGYEMYGIHSDSQGRKWGDKYAETIVKPE